MGLDIARYEWFKSVILPHEPALRGRLRRLVGRADEVDDLVAECLARAYAVPDFGRFDAGRAFCSRSPATC